MEDQSRRSENGRALASELRRLVAEIRQEEYRERKMLADKVHGSLQQLLVAARMRLSWHQQGEGRTSDTELERVEGWLADCLTITSDLVQELGPPVRELEEIDDLVRWLADRYRDKHGLAVEVVTRGELPRVPETTRVFVFQAVRQLLGNVLEHSGGIHARITLSSSQEGWLVVEILDGGKGFEPGIVEKALQGRAGFGLFDLHQRSILLGGDLQCGNAADGGALLRLRLPAHDSPRTGPAT